MPTEYTGCAIATSVSSNLIGFQSRVAPSLGARAVRNATPERSSRPLKSASISSASRSSWATMMRKSFICSSGICGLNTATGLITSPTLPTTTPAPVNSRRPSSLSQVNRTATSDGAARSYSFLAASGEMASARGAARVIRVKTIAIVRDIHISYGRSAGSVIYAHDGRPRGAAALDVEEHAGLLLLDRRLVELRQLVQVLDGLPVDGADDVAGLEFGLLRRIARAHRRHGDAEVVVELAGVGVGAGAVADAHAPRLQFLLFADRAFQLLGGGVELERLVGALYFHRHLSPDGQVGDHFVGRGDLLGEADVGRLAVELQEDVLRLHARLGRRRAPVNAVDEDAFVNVDRVEGLQVLERFELDAKVAALDAASLVFAGAREDRADDFLGGVDGHGEVEVLPAAAGVDADHLAGHIHQRAAGVAGVDRGVHLDPVGELAG